jgi:sugar lactone lactonase YvrE
VLKTIIGEAPIEKIAGGFQFTEGPIWVPRGYLLFSDIPANKIYKWSPVTKLEIFRSPSGHSNGLTLDKKGRLLACEQDLRRVSITKEDGSVVTFADRYKGKRLNSPNDIIVKSNGSIYFTDPAFIYARADNTEVKELDFNGVYRLTPEGELTLLDDSFEGPNGLAFSPDEKVLYVDDSRRGHIRAFDVKENGLLTNSRLFAELKDPGEKGVPDGMKVDVQGNIFCTGPGGIWVLDPEGVLLGVIKFPEVPANLAWGDDDLKTMYVTARTGLYRLRIQTGGASLLKV